VTRYSRNLFLLMLAVLAGGSAMPDVGAPSGVSAAPASLVSAGQPVASEHSGRATAVAREQGDDAAGEPVVVMGAVPSTGGQAQNSVLSLRQGHAGGGSSGFGLLSAGPLPGQDLTDPAGGRAALSAARHVARRAHGIRAGPRA